MSEKIGYEQALGKLYEDRDPSFPDVSDGEIKATLEKASAGVPDTLREIMVAPLRNSYARIEQLLGNPAFVERINELAYFHPVDSIPYTTHMPGMQRMHEDGVDSPEEYVRNNLPKALNHNTEVGGLGIRDAMMYRTELNEFTLSVAADKNAVLSDEQWELWEAAHTAQDKRNHCIMGALALNLARVRYRDNPFTNIERHIINKLYTHRIPTQKVITATNSHRPNSRLLQLPEVFDDAEEERWVRSATVLATLVQDDGYLRQTVAGTLENSEHYRRMIDTRTMRGFADSPKDLALSVINGYNEAIIGVIPGTTSELQRSSASIGWDAGIAEIIAFRQTSAITQRSPLGYGGPNSVQGVGLANPPSERMENRRRTRRYPGSHRRRVGQAATTSLKAAQMFWKREFHYGELLRTRDESTEPIRTGEACPFAQTPLIEATQQMIFLISRHLESGVEPKYDLRKGRVYRPSEAPSVKEFLDASEPDSLPYRRLGLEAAREVLRGI